MALGIRPVPAATKSGDLRFNGDPKAIGGLTSLLQALTSQPLPEGAATRGR